MPMTSCHLVVEENPAIVYASRNGSPDRILPILNRFLETFWQERDMSGDAGNTPECLVAQIVVRFGFEICEDDYSNLRVGVKYDPSVQYLYCITADRQVQVWVPETPYQNDPELGLKGCRELMINTASADTVN